MRSFAAVLGVITITGDGGSPGGLAARERGAGSVTPFTGCGVVIVAGKRGKVLPVPWRADYYSHTHKT